MGTRGNWRKIRKHRNYTVEEVARTIGVCKGTVRRWIVAGLPALTDQKPALLLGADLICFLQSRTKPKRRCKLDQCYCFKCRTPRHAAFREAEFMPDKPTSGLLCALCEVCATVMYKRVSNARFAELAKLLDVSIRQADGRISDS